MKKFILSGLVIVTFMAYSYHQRQEGSGLVLVPSSKATSGSSGSGGTQPAQGQSTQSSSTTTSTGTTSASGRYKDGTYIGSVADAFYGNIQVRVSIQNGRITSVQFLQHPSDSPTSRDINGQAMPYLQQEAIQAQNAHVDTISGATDTSMAFIQSLTAALAQA